jgi:serine protease Do
LAVRQVLPWVVNIGTERMVKTNDGYDAFYNQFFGTFYRARTKMVKEYFPLGSGVIVDSRGLVLTNHHVVRRANNAEVRLWNGESYPAVLVGYDAPSDLCLLRLSGDFTAKPLQAARFANPDDLMLGETVLTIGNPFGLEHSVSQGVLSAMNRSLNDGDIVYDDILQTDAAINPGNSGGPLLNLRGEVIGINTAIASSSGGSEGIGFSIPIKMVMTIANQLIEQGNVVRAYLGVRLDARFDAQRAAAVGLSRPSGALVSAVTPNSPAAEADLREGDVVLRVNDVMVEDDAHLVNMVSLSAVGESINLLVFRNGATLAVKVRVGKRDDFEPE